MRKQVIFLMLIILLILPGAPVRATYLQAQPHFSISGTVTLADLTPLANVKITYGIMPGDFVLTGANGVYTISGLPSGDYTLTPTLADTIFAPISSLVTVGPDQTGIDFTATPVYKIQGTITLVGTTTGLAGVSISYGSMPGDAVVTAGDGSYTIDGLLSGSYTLTPTLAEYTFNPTTGPVTVGPSANGIDFSASRNTYSIAGKVTLTGTANGVGGVTIRFGSQPTDYVITGGSGNFVIDGLTNGDYTLTPSLANFIFSPVSSSVTVGGNKSGINFSAIPVYTIHGKVTLSGTTSGLAGVTISYGSLPTDAVITAGDGTYTITDLVGGDYTLTPSLAEYTFSPPTGPVTAGPGVSDVDFMADRVVYAVSGKITRFKGSTSGVPGVTVQALQAAQVMGQAVSGADGNYSIPGLVSGTYTIQPVSPGKVRVSPSDAHVNRVVTLGPAQNGVNFQVEFDSYLPSFCAACDSKVFYQDFFDSDRGWQVVLVGGGSANVQGGVYVMKNTTTLKNMISLAPYSGSSLPDSGYSLKVTATRVVGVNDDPSFGVVFDWISSGNFYLFQIDTDLRMFYIEKNGTVIANFETSDSIAPGGLPNTLEIRRLASSIEFYINGIKVKTTSAPAISAGTKGKMGLQLSTYNTAAEVHFDNFYLRQQP